MFISRLEASCRYYKVLLYLTAFSIVISYFYNNERAALLKSTQALFTHPGFDQDLGTFSAPKSSSYLLTFCIEYFIPHSHAPENICTDFCLHNGKMIHEKRKHAYCSCGFSTEKQSIGPLNGNGTNPHVDLLAYLSHICGKYQPQILAMDPYFEPKLPFSLDLHKNQQMQQS